VAVRAREVRGAPAGDGVERLLPRDAAREDRQRVAAAHDPLVGTEPGGALSYLLDHGLGGGQVVEVALGQLDPAAHGMHVGVVKPLQDHAPRQVDDPRARAPPRLGVLGRPHEHDPPAAHGHRLGPGSGRIHRVDGGARQKQVGGRARRRRQRKKEGAYLEHGAQLLPHGSCGSVTG
jgi:hypothetical protein